MFLLARSVLTPPARGTGLPLLPPMQPLVPRPPAWGLGAGAAAWGGPASCTPVAWPGYSQSHRVGVCQCYRAWHSTAWGSGCLLPFTFVLLCGWAIYCLFAQRCCAHCGALAHVCAPGPPLFRAGGHWGLWHGQMRSVFSWVERQEEAARALSTRGVLLSCWRHRRTFTYTYG